MTRLGIKIRINAPREKVWDVLADLGGMYRWNPSLLYSYCTSINERGEGATVHCDAHRTGVYLKQRVVEWSEGEGYKLEVYESSFPFRRSLLNFTLSVDGASTIAGVSHKYQLKYGPVGTLIDNLWWKRTFKKAIKDLLVGLKFHVRTGVPVSDRVPNEG